MRRIEKVVRSIARGEEQDTHIEVKVNGKTAYSGSLQRFLEKYLEEDKPQVLTKMEHDLLMASCVAYENTPLREVPVLGMMLNIAFKDVDACLTPKEILENFTFSKEEDK